jgi:hypothetical protein
MFPSMLVTDQFRFFTSYTQWLLLSSVSKCYVTDICVPSHELNNVPMQQLHEQQFLKIWIYVICPSDIVLNYILQKFPFITGFLLRIESIHTPEKLFDTFHATIALKQKLSPEIKLGWVFQWYQYPFSPKSFGWIKKNELSRPYLPPVETVINVCLINWNAALRPKQFHVYFKRLLHIRIPSNIIVVPYMPEKPIPLYEKNVFGLATHHLSIDSIPVFFPLEKPCWLEIPSCTTQKYKKEVTLKKATE